MKSNQKAPKKKTPPQHLLLTLRERFLWEFLKSIYESALVRKWDMFGQQLHCTLVRAETALCGCIMLNIMRNQALIYCCLQALTVLRHRYSLLMATLASHPFHKHLLFHPAAICSSVFAHGVVFHSLTLPVTQKVFS